MKKKIYFADLMYDTGILSCDYFPIGSGYVAAYAKALFDPSCDIKIFKYVDKLFRLAEKEPPDIFAGSCYVWNKNLVLLVSRMIKKQNPKCLIVLGGPAFPLEEKKQKEFLLKNKHVDFFVPYDGEIAFANLLKKYFSVDGNAEKIKKTAAEGTICLNDRGEVDFGGSAKRPKNLDIFPSPYLTGIFDKFFAEKKFTPLMQTTRGCPFTCAYCWASNRENKCIGFFSMERVTSELNFIAENATKNGVYDLVLCDANFGLYEKDFKITDTIYRLQQEYNYPRIFNVPFAKEAGDEYSKYFSKLKGVAYYLSTQSTDPKILENVKRKKVDLCKITEHVNAVHIMGKNVGTEIITGLPYETRETHMRTLRDLIDCGFDLIDPFTFMLLDGIELNTEAAHKKFKYDVRYRLIPRDFGKINENYVFEIEEVVVGTNTFAFEDYLYIRGLHGLFRILRNNSIYKELLQYIKQHGIHLLDWFIFVFEDLRSNMTQEAAKCFNEYIKETQSELWNSPEELVSYYSREENFNKLLTRERGDNLMQKCSILPVSIYFELYVDYFIGITKRYLGEKYKERKNGIERELDVVRKFILARLSGVLKQNIQKSQSFSADYDILKWIKDNFIEPLSGYKLAKPKTVTLELSDEQIELIKSVFDRYDFDEKNPYALYRAVVLVSIDNYFREVKNYEKKKESDVKNKKMEVEEWGRKLQLEK